MVKAQEDPGVPILPLVLTPSLQLPRHCNLDMDVGTVEIICAGLHINAAFGLVSIEEIKLDLNKPNYLKSDKEKEARNLLGA